MPAVSQAQRGYLASHFGSEWLHKHHFDNKGKLPAHKHKKKPSKKAFIEAFAAGCVRDGLDPAGVAARAASLLGVKKADDPVSGLGHFAGQTLGGLKDLGINGFLLGTIGLPAAAGTMTGLIGGHMHNQADAADLDARRRLALARVYQRKADELAARRDAQKLETSQPNKYVVLG